MRKLQTLIAALLLLVAGNSYAQPSQQKDSFQTKSGKTVTITHIKHATMQITYEGKHIYVDPVTELHPRTDWNVYPKADYILITHEHPDHFDQMSIAQLRGASTPLYLNRSTQGYLHGSNVVMDNGDSLRIGDDIWLWAVPAYNTTPEHAHFHPKGRDNGYVLQLDGLRIYIAGDTEDIPEMANLKDIDIAFLPCNQPYTMTIDQLVSAAKTIKPKVLFPYHYGDTRINMVLMKMVGSGIDVRIRNYK
ncbi:MAG: MBL fold metallo-hydrolase [Prevotella sp.]|nr:MBL fold metallo-hydrolase [Prevotella sp.]